MICCQGCGDCAAEIRPIGFAGNSAEQFFGTLKLSGFRRLMDIRLNNTSQLAGFTKSTDLEYFLHEVCDAEYVHELFLAPTREIMGFYRKRGGSWPNFELAIAQLLRDRTGERTVLPELFRVPAVMLWCEPSPEYSHRQLVGEYLQQRWHGLAACP